MTLSLLPKSKRHPSPTPHGHQTRLLLLTATQERMPAAGPVAIHPYMGLLAVLTHRETHKCSYDPAFLRAWGRTLCVLTCHLAQKSDSVSVPCPVCTEPAWLQQPIEHHFLFSTENGSQTSSAHTPPYAWKASPSSFLSFRHLLSCPPSRSGQGQGQFTIFWLDRSFRFSEQDCRGSHRQWSISLAPHGHSSHRGLRLRISRPSQFLRAKIQNFYMKSPGF